MCDAPKADAAWSGRTPECEEGEPRAEQLVANVQAALEEPARFARLDGTLYYDCELGTRFRVEKALLLATWRANRNMKNARTVVVDAIPGEATVFDLGEAELSGDLVELEVALDDWALWCDEYARTRGHLRVL